MGCDFSGLEEFVKLVEEADLDPIYYCKKNQSLSKYVTEVRLTNIRNFYFSVNDNGDCKFILI